MTIPGSRSESGFRFVGEREIHDGYVIRLVEGEFETPDGHTMMRDIVRHPGAVGVVAVDDDDTILVRQYRAPIHTEILEIPAGRRDVEGEPPELTARRELVEEVGLQAGSMVPIGGFHNSVGFCDEYIHLFLATDLSSVPTDHDGPEEAHMTVERMALADVAAAIDDGTISDAKTVIGLLAALRHLGR